MGPPLRRNSMRTVLFAVGVSWKRLSQPISAVSANDPWPFIMQSSLHPLSKEQGQLGALAAFQLAAYGMAARWPPKPALPERTRGARSLTGASHLLSFLCLARPQVPWPLTFREGQTKEQTPDTAPSGGLFCLIQAEVSASKACSTKHQTLSMRVKL